jgi:hypothetical protein
VGYIATGLNDGFRMPRGRHHYYAGQAGAETLGRVTVRPTDGVCADIISGRRGRLPDLAMRWRS